MNAALAAKVLRLADMAQDIAATIPEGVGHHTPCGVDALVAEIRAELAPAQEEAPRPWVWDGDVLRVDGREVGRVGRVGVWWTAGDADGKTIVMHDERTARAVVVALAGYNPGVTFVLTLRPDWTREGIDEAISHDLGSYVAGMLEGHAEGYDDPQQSDNPDVARRWWAGGYKALNLASKDPDDDCPF